MPVLSLKLSETPFSGNGTQRKHEFILRAEGMTDDQVMDWLTTENATFTEEVERPSGTRVTESPLTNDATPILLEYAGRTLKDLEYQLERDADPEHYRITATYEYDTPGSGSELEPTLGVDGVTFGFEIGPENAVLRYSLATVAAYPPASGSAFAPDMNQAINVQPDGTVDGVQVPSSPQQISMQFTQAKSWFTPSKLLALSRARGKVNSTI